MPPPFIHEVNVGFIDFLKYVVDKPDGGLALFVIVMAFISMLGVVGQAIFKRFQSFDDED